MYRHARRWFSLLGLLALVSGSSSTARAGYVFVYFQPSGSADTEPYGITNGRMVSGLYADSGGVYHGFTYQNGNLTSIDAPVPGSLGTNLFQTNNSGLIAGGYIDSGGIYHAAVYDSANQSWSYLPDPFGSSQFNEAGGINDSGQVFGNWADNANFVNLHGWYYQLGMNPGYQSFFDAAGADPTQAGTLTYGANNAGLNVGFYLDSSADSHGFIYNSLTNTFSYYDVPGAISTQIYGINNNGVIVGRYRMNPGDNTQGFILDNGVLTTINVPPNAPPGDSNLYLTGINDRGDLVGYSFDAAADSYNGFVAFAVPEPSTLVGCGIAAIALVGYSLRRRAKAA